MHPSPVSIWSPCLITAFCGALVACAGQGPSPAAGGAGGGDDGPTPNGGAIVGPEAGATGGSEGTGGRSGGSGGAVSGTGGSNLVVDAMPAPDASAVVDASAGLDARGSSGGTGGATRASGGSSGSSGGAGSRTLATGGAAGNPGTGGTAGSTVPRGGSGGARDGGATGGTTGGGGTRATGGSTGTGGLIGTGGATAVSTGGATGSGGEMWPNIRVVGNHLCDRWGKPFAVRGIESMFGNGTSDAKAFAAGHKALGANAMGPLPNTSVSSVANIEALLAAAYEAGLVIGLNADHTGQGEKFFASTQIQTVVNRYPNVFLQEAVELGSDMTASQWVASAQAKVDAYVSRYPDKPLKIGSPMGGRSPRYALDHCQEVVDYYYAKGGRGGLIFTCQLYWKAATSSWSYQQENGFDDGLPGILQAVDAMAASPCAFLPGLDNEDDVGYTGWREIMDHVRGANADAGLRLGYQWWVYFNSGDAYDNDLTSNAANALAGITATGTAVKAKLDLDRRSIELGPLNP